MQLTRVDCCDGSVCSVCAGEEETRDACFKKKRGEIWETGREGGVLLLGQICGGRRRETGREGGTTVSVCLHRACQDDGCSTDWSSRVDGGRRTDSDTDRGEWVWARTLRDQPRPRRPRRRRRRQNEKKKIGSRNPVRRKRGNRAEDETGRRTRGAADRCSAVAVRRERDGGQKMLSVITVGR